MALEKPSHTLIPGSLSLFLCLPGCILSSLPLLLHVSTRAFFSSRKPGLTWTDVPSPLCPHQELTSLPGIAMFLLSLIILLCCSLGSVGPIPAPITGHGTRFAKQQSVLHLWPLCCCFSVTKSCLTLCDPMDCRTPGLPVLHCLQESAQIHVHWVSDAIEPSHPLPPSSPFAFNLSQHQSLF